MAIRLPLLLALAAPSTSAPSLFPDRPRVLSALPDLSDTDVDPTVTTLRIEFDQDMYTRGGMLSAAALPPSQYL